MELGSFYNRSFSKEKCFSVTKEFQKENDYLIGEVEVNTVKEKLKFIVVILSDYPYKKLSFFTNSIENYPHLQNTDTYGNYLCIHVPFSNKIETKLQWDIKALNEWIERYYINDEIDD